MNYLVLVRHGQSIWNLENRFTGDVDVDLTDQGREEARMTGVKMRALHFDIAHTSTLKRAQETLDIILREIGQQNLQITRDAALNERNYGELQGLNKAETAERYGEAKVHSWRRSFSDRPPGGESLEDTQVRVLKYFDGVIAPELTAGKNVLVVAHGNSLRALMMHLEKLSPEAISQIDIATGVPRMYLVEEGIYTVKDI